MANEDSIQKLLSLFLQYKKTRTKTERAKLDAEIMRLFDTLGATLTSEMVDVRGEFEAMRTLPGVERASIIRIRAAATRFAKSRLTVIEDESSSVDLSWGARELLRVPMVEAYELAEFRNTEQTDESLRSLARSLREEPTSPSEGHGRFRTSIAVIRAYAENFCNIPPFCSGKGRV